MTMAIGRDMAVLAAAYLTGCFLTGYYLVLARSGEDVRTRGSGSAGARNVARLMGTQGFVLTFLGDCAKGALVVVAAQKMGLHPGGVMLALLAVVVGHIWPVQLRFHGGKGIATALGALLVFDYRLVLVVAGITGLVYCLARRFTPSGLLAFALCPVAAALLGHPPVVVLGTGALAGLLLIAHRENLYAMVSGRRNSADATGAAPDTSGEET